MVKILLYTKVKWLTNLDLGFRIKYESFEDMVSNFKK